MTTALLIGGPRDGEYIDFTGLSLDIFRLAQPKIIPRADDKPIQCDKGRYRRSDANPQFAYWEGWQ